MGPTDCHATHGGNTKISPIHQTDAVQEAASEDQTDVDPPDDLLLLRWREGIDTALVAEMIVGVL